VVAELNSIHQQIATETAQIISAMGRDVEVARSRVNTLQAMVVTSQAQAQRGLSAAATLAQLNQAVEARRHVYIAFLTRMEQTQLAATNFPTAHVVSPAIPPARPDGMQLWMGGLLGVIAATFAAIAAVLLRFVLRGKISSSKDMELLTGMAPVGAMPALPGAGGLPIPMRILDMAQTGTVETLHAVRFAIQSMNPGPRCTRVLVTSSKQGEGKTTLAASLARLSAATGIRVLLVEADLRRPTLSRMLRLSSKISIEFLFSHGLTLADAVQVDRKSGLHCLVSNGSAHDAVITLQSPRFSELMSEAELSYDMVVIDSPPVMRVIDPLILSRFSDVILFAVASGRTPSTVVTEALNRFPVDVRSRVATVLTRVPQSEADWNGYYAGYRRKLPALV
jgi:capsular exopolysaccharide synthesis family protein